MAVGGSGVDVGAGLLSLPGAVAPVPPLPFDGGTEVGLGVGEGDGAGVGVGGNGPAAKLIYRSGSIDESV